MVETAALLMLFLTLVLGMLDLGIGVMRFHVLSLAARHLARQAIVHGKLADRLGDWGTSSFTGTAADSGPIPAALQPALTGLPLNQVNVQVVWIDGGNDVRDDDRVSVTLTTTYQPVLTLIFGVPIPLTTRSTMPIAH